MNTHELKTAIQTLRDDLAANPQIDIETTALLQRLDRDIHAHLDAGSANRDIVATPATDLSDRAQQLAARFAAEHPVLEASARAVAEALAKMGI